MEQRVSTNSFKKGFRTYLNIIRGKPLKAISEQTSNKDLRPVQFGESVEVPLPCGAQGRVRSESEGKVKATAISSENQPSTRATRIWRNKFTISSGVVIIT